MKNVNFGHKKGLGFPENRKEGYHPLDAVEKTDQCAGCQRFLRLGSGQFCFTVDDDKIRAAEIVSWTPEGCDHFLEMPNPLLSACNE